MTLEQAQRIARLIVLNSAATANDRLAALENLELIYSQHLKEEIEKAKKSIIEEVPQSRNSYKAPFKKDGVWCVQLKAKHDEWNTFYPEIPVVVYNLVHDKLASKQIYSAIDLLKIWTKLPNVDIEKCLEDRGNWQV
jgi:hypothetical protein